jgi:hypothetical protein
MKGNRVGFMTTSAKYRRKWIGSILISFIVSTVMTATVAAREDGYTTRRSNVRPQDVVTSTALAGVTLSSKTPLVVYTRTGGMYNVSDTIVIIDENGAKITLNRLRLPCEADVTYSVDQGHRLARKIQVTSVSKDASEAFIVENQLE